MLGFPKNASCVLFVKILSMHYVLCQPTMATIWNVLEIKNISISILTL